MLVFPFRCRQALFLTISSVVNASTLRSFSRVLVPGLYFPLLQNTHVSCSTVELPLDPCRSQELHLSWDWSFPVSMLSVDFLVRISKLFWLTNPFLQLAWYFTWNLGKSCSPVDRSRIWWCCLIAAVRYQTVPDSHLSRCRSHNSPFLLFEIIQLITQITHAHAKQKWLHFLSCKYRFGYQAISAQGFSP